MPNQLEEALSKAAGKTHAVMYRIKGLTGVFATLAEQHSEASVLLARAKSAKDAEKRANLWHKIRTELLSHERAELAEVYPRLLDYANMKELVAQHKAEAAELEAAVRRVDESDVASDAWHHELIELIAMVKHHVDEEENELFPAALDLLGEDMAKGIEGRFLAAKKSFAEQLVS